ncbi:MAG: hypothetical protein JXL97_00220 [Bacteroidales bacterium]|nr:hypothetical protein [Bacteroidales bacterium]
MKKITTILLLLSFFVISFGQTNDNSEYRYLAFKFFLTNNISFPAPENNNVMIKSPYGDMMKQNNEIFSYTPGGGMAVVFNYDFKSDKLGLIFGLDVQDLGFKNYYKSVTGNFLVTSQYRALQVGLPIMVKFGSSNIYKNQSYVTFGVQFNQYFLTQNIQKSSWNEAPYVATLPREEIKKSSISAMLGFNYSVYFVNFQLNSTNFVNPDFMTNTNEGVVSPYSHINILNNLYIQTGINIPMTRWLTARNWSAEKIRRFLTRTE